MRLSPQQHRAPVRPTLLDRAIAALDPVRGAKRLASRHAYMAMSGGYTGARHNRRATQEWSAPQMSADAAILPDLATLRDRTRDLERNAPLAGGAIAGVVSNVVGEGLRPKAHVDRVTLGLDEEAADRWEREAETYFGLWARSQNCDVTRTQTFAGLQDLVFRAALSAGDVFVTRRRAAREGWPFALALQVIEGDLVTNPRGLVDGGVIASGQDGGGNRCAGGVELDADGAPVAYHALKTHPGGLMNTSREWVRLPAFGAQSGERMVWHVFERSRPNQTRGVPYLAPVIEAFKQLERYTDAELMAAVVGAMFTVFVKTEGRTGLAPVAPTTETGASTTDKDIRLGNGMIVDLAPGESVEVAQPGRPNQAFDPFVLAILKQIAVGLQVPFEVLTKHFNASYSASRAAMLDAWRFYRGRRAFLATGFCQPVWEAVIGEAVLTGRLAAPGFANDPFIRAAWLGCDWIGPSPGQIDPTKEIDAAKTRIEVGVSTLEQETAALSGGDWETNLDQRAREERRKRSLGLLPPPAPAAPPAGGSDSRDNADDSPEDAAPPPAERDPAA